MIPSIDLRAFLAASAREQTTIAEKVDEICKHSGFLIVTNHGVPDRVIDKAWTASKTFFDLSLEEKLRSRSPDPGCPRGYFPLSTEALAKSRGVDTPPDNKESFGIGPLLAPDLKISADRLKFHYGENLWPATPANLRDALTAYYVEMQALAMRVLSLFAIALDLPHDYFEQFHRHPMSALRCINYPAPDGLPLADQKAAGEHSDYGSITLLRSDPIVPGLEIRLPNGQWAAAPLVRDGFIVNIGDMMARWTNDRWVSTMHRVTSPTTGECAARRQSMAFFYNASFDAAIDCLPTCRGAGDTGKYPPVSAGAYLAERFGATIS